MCVGGGVGGWVEWVGAWGGGFVCILHDVRDLCGIDNNYHRSGVTFATQAVCLP